MENKEFRFSDSIPEGKKIGLRWDDSAKESRYCLIDDPDYVKLTEDIQKSDLNQVIDINARINMRGKITISSENLHDKIEEAFGGKLLEMKPREDQ
jgi:hypothetical protein